MLFDCGSIGGKNGEGVGDDDGDSVCGSVGSDGESTVMVMVSVRSSLNVDEEEVHSLKFYKKGNVP